MVPQRYGFLFLLILSSLWISGCAKEADRQPAATFTYDWNRDQGIDEEDIAECTDSSQRGPPELPAGIVGGEQVQNSNWLGRGIVFLMQNYQSEEGKDRSSICTATLIDTNVILTAAHCVDRSTGDQMKNLSVYFTSKPECENNRGRLHKLKRRVVSVKVHPYWNPDDTKLTDRGDIALVKFSGRAPKGYKPLKLANEFIPVNEVSPVLVAGYGMVNPNYYGDFGGDIELRVTSVQGISAEKRESLWRINQSNFAANDSERHLFSNQYGNEMLYIDQSQGRGICGGDSGGPSLMKNSRGEDVITGVASFVMNPEDPYLLCGYVGAHTSVLFHKNWLNETFSQLRSKDSQLQTLIE